MRSITRRHVCALVCAGVVTALAACGSATSVTAGAGAGASQPAAQNAPASSARGSGTESNGGGGACALATTAEVAAAVGRDITVANGAGSTCIYQGADPSQAFALQTYSSVAEMATQLSIEDASLHVDGLGTDAFYSKVGGILFARNGDHGLSLTDITVGLNNPGQPPPDALVQLAVKVLAKL